jgi:hypothetical protein
MAIVKSGSAGSFRGKVGDKIYRKVNGKTVVVQAPEFINVSNSNGCLKSRHAFRIAEDLSKTIKSDELLYGLWDKVKPSGNNKFSRIMKANLGVINEKGINERNVITPDSETVPSRFRNNCTLLSKKSLGLNRDGLYAEVKVHRENADILAPPYSAYFVVYLGKQDNPESLPEYKFLPFDINVDEESDNEYQSFEIVFDEAAKELILKYSYATILFALVKINNQTKKYEWSKTETLETLL